MHDSKSAISVQNLITQLAGTFSMMRTKDEELEVRSETPRINSPKSSTKEPEREDWNGLYGN
jgi:hypothetical protein